jgi:outer membrane protein OmpA-like peptidoglycan-associated protein
MRDGALRLNGEVPDAATREAIVDAARTKVSPPRIREVVDALHVTERAAPSGYLAACLRGLDVLPRCEAGAVALSQGTFSVHCDVTRASVEGVRAAAREPVEGVHLGEVELLVSEEVQACERALETILRASTIEFDINSAVIRATNAPLLDRVAAAARQCPGHLRVEGHTDNVGTLALNLPLSRQRAASVVEALTQRGVEGPRLRAEGFGPTRPLADNASAAGRARNRRIEIHVVHDGE